jgi:hypothetical protein
MGDKKELIAEYAILTKQQAIVADVMDTDPGIRDCRTQHKTISDNLKFLLAPYETELAESKRRQDEIKEELKRMWDSEDKTFKCVAGVAMLRTTKSLVITDKANMIQRLSEILTGHLIEACVYIKTFDLTRARKLKDAGLIDDKIAHYEKKQNVVIKVAEED